MAKARFFYALCPDATAADGLAALAAGAAARWGGSAFAAADIHLTLAFVGLRPLEEQPALEAILQGLPTRFDGAGAAAVSPAGERQAGDVGPIPALELSRIGSFGHGVLWIGPPGQPRWASPARTFAHRLAHEIRERLRAAGVGFDDRPLKLHATIVRGARDFVADPAPDAPDAPQACPILVRTWSLALGASAPDATPLRRYRWWSPPVSARPE